MCVIPKKGRTDLDLDGRDGVHGVRAPQRRGAAFGHADVADEALRDEALERADDLFDRPGRVDARALKEVDGFGAAQRGVDCSHAAQQVLGPTGVLVSRG